MEYKYHPAFKHLTFFIIVYLFLRHQEIMTNELLFINSIIITVFLIILDHLFIHNHLTPLQSLSDQYFDDIDIVQLEQEIFEKENEESDNSKKKKKKSKKNQNKDVEKMTPINDEKKCINKLDNNNNNNHNDYVHIGLNNYDINQEMYNHETNNQNYNNFNDNLDEYPEYLAYNE